MKSIGISWICGLLFINVLNAQTQRELCQRIDSLDQVGEIHLAGFAEQVDGNNDRLLIDSHGSPVAQAVWDLYAFTLGLTGPVATLLERDNDIPAWSVLLAEANLANEQLSAVLEEVNA